MKDRGRPDRRQGVGDLVSIEQVHALPARQPREIGRGLGSRPADKIGRPGQVFKKVAAGEPGSSGHENDGIAHRLRLAEEAEEVGERPEAGQHE